MRSDAIKRGPERAPHRALLHATGVSPSELDHPFIGVANAASDLVPFVVSGPGTARYGEFRFNEAGASAAELKVQHGRELIEYAMRD